MMKHRKFELLYWNNQMQFSSFLNFMDAEVTTTSIKAEPANNDWISNGQAEGTIPKKSRISGIERQNIYSCGLEGKPGWPCSISIRASSTLPCTAMLSMAVSWSSATLGSAPLMISDLTRQLKQYAFYSLNLFWSYYPQEKAEFTSNLSR